MGQVLKHVSKISGIYGQPGEEKVSRTLAENLPGSYVILNSPRVYYHGATIDIDHVVIGPNGIFVIETKNMQGSVSGGLMGNWVQERKRTGRHRRVKIGNPANQVNQYGKVIRSFLGSRAAYENGRKINFRIYPVVVFVHDEVDLSGMDFTKPGYVGRVRVLKMNDLVKFILTREGASYSDEEINRFARMIVPEEQRDQTSYFSLDMLSRIGKNNGDRYEMFEELGRGSFGVVLRGYDYKLDEEIAVKKLAAGKPGAPGMVDRFFREARIASGLEHENIVRVYDFFEDSGEYYIVMELVEGKTLEEYVHGKTVPVSEALRITREICRALEYAHARQVVHRDLKPSNILIDREGRVKISDFGVAKLMSGTDLTLDGTTAGTPASMAPEQITGQAVTEKTDLFAVGVLLYYLVTGQMPFAGEHLGEIVHKITHVDPVPPRQLNSQITRDLEAVILKALNKNPGDRFASAGEFGQALDNLAQNRRLPSGIHSPKAARLVRAVFRPLFGTELNVFALITITSLIIVVGILGFQVYRQSRQLAQEAVLTKQYGFTNDNLGLLYENPGLYMGLPVSLVGRIDKIVRSNEDGIQFSMVLNSGDRQQDRSIVVRTNQPGLSLKYTSYIKITGSIQNTVNTPENGRTPFIIAEKVEPITDPWSILAPAQFTIYPGKTVNQGGKVVELEKVEFAATETRLFVRVKNEGPADDVLVLANPIGRQDGKTFGEFSGSYRTRIKPVIRLQTGEEAREVIFLKPLSRQKSPAVFILGSTNDILLGQQPYVFEVKW